MRFQSKFLKVFSSVVVLVMAAMLALFLGCSVQPKAVGNLPDVLAPTQSQQAAPTPAQQMASADEYLQSSVANLAMLYGQAKTLYPTEVAALDAQAQQATGNPTATILTGLQNAAATYHQLAMATSTVASPPASSSASDSDSAWSIARDVLSDAVSALAPIAVKAAISAVGTL